MDTQQLTHLYLPFPSHNIGSNYICIPQKKKKRDSNCICHIYAFCFFLTHPYLTDNPLGTTMKNFDGITLLLLNLFARLFQSLLTPLCSSQIKENLSPKMIQDKHFKNLHASLLWSLNSKFPLALLFNWLIVIVVTANFNPLQQQT